MHVYLLGKTTFLTNGIKLSKQSRPQVLAEKIFEFDFTDYPDLAQTFAVTLSMLNIPFKLSGLESLQIKETNRIKALKNELLKLGINLTQPESGILEWNNSLVFQYNNKFKTSLNSFFTPLDIFIWRCY